MRILRLAFGTFRSFVILGPAGNVNYRPGFFFVADSLTPKTKRRTLLIMVRARALTLLFRTKSDLRFAGKRKLFMTIGSGVSLNTSYYT